MLGDGMHNLVDGFVIGIAFTYCSSSVAWSIAATTISHEIAQELGDYVNLTVRAGLKPPLALGLNFVAGIPIFLGAIIALGGDPSAEVRGDAPVRMSAQNAPDPMSPNLTGPSITCRVGAAVRMLSNKDNNNGNNDDNNHMCACLVSSHSVRSPAVSGQFVPSSARQGVRRYSASLSCCAT